MRIVFKNFRIVDAESDFFGSLVVENGFVKKIIPGETISPGAEDSSLAEITLDGRAFPPSAVLMPAFIDLHAHFRDPGFPEKETLDSASLAAAAGGFATVVCMANTSPVTDTFEKALAVKKRADTIGLIDLYPVLSLTKSMEGQELSGIADLPTAGADGIRLPLLLSEDGKDVADEGLFLAAMKEAKRLGLPISCHCDFGGPEAQAAQKAGRPRAEWSRIEEINAVRRAVELGKKAGCHIHIAHVSTREAIDIIRETKKNLSENCNRNGSTENGFALTCEAAPHHFGATEEDARRMGEESYGRVNPPLRSEADRLALIAAIRDGTIDAIATDHAPHSAADKAGGAPGFSGLETAFAASLSHLTNTAIASDELRRLSALLSDNPARILGLRERGRITTKGCPISKNLTTEYTELHGASVRKSSLSSVKLRGEYSYSTAPRLRADIVIVDTQAKQVIDPYQFKSRGKCSPFTGRELTGKVLMTFNAGKITFNGGQNV